MSVQDAPIEQGTLRLRERSNWPEWYALLQFHANSRLVWDKIDPDALDVTLQDLEPPPLPTREQSAQAAARESEEAYHLSLQVYEDAIREHAAVTNSQHMSVPGTRATTPNTQGDELVSQTPRPPVKPVFVPATDAQIDALYTEARKIYALEVPRRLALSNRVATIAAWVNNSVDAAQLATIMTRLQSERKYTLQALVRELRRHFAPSNSSMVTSVRDSYNAALLSAKQNSVAPLEWFRRWNVAYERAKLYNIPETTGTLATKDFLRAVGARIAPEWSRRSLQELSASETLGLIPRTLEDHARILTDLLHEQNMHPNQRPPSILATPNLSTPDTSNDKGSQDPPSARAKHRGGTTDDQGYNCPCKSNHKDKHKWPPEACGKLEYALTGKTRFRTRFPDEKLCNEIKKRLTYKHWRELVPKLVEKGWMKQDSAENTNSGNGYLGSLTAVTIDPNLAEHSKALAGLAPGVYSIMDFSRHPLADSTVLDNCGAVHLVNDVELLVPGSFVPSQEQESVEAGTQTIPIIGKGTRKLEKALHGAKGPNTEDLTLSDVAVVPGFHVNIISEARLRQAGAWYLGLDCSLRAGSLKENVLLATLKRAHNLVFFEYKPLSSYSLFSLARVPRCIPTSAAGMVMLSVQHHIARRSMQTFQRSDSEDLWHLRAGHLGPKALRALVQHARNVKINGTPRRECEYCARTYATKIVSRRTSERRAPRPFYRISWDLFDMERSGFDGSCWLLALKDEYSGKLWTVPLQNKALPTLMHALRTFESWVKRQYGLSICKIRQDNDSATLPWRGKGEYEHWAEEEGIDIEPTPPYTKEPNGGAERAGQAIIDRSIAMRTAACLPEDLWPEVVQAAAWLQGMSPSHSHDMRSPNEVLDAWFTQYFRWYTPELVRRLTSDLRPDWSGIYAYGCRAYPLNKERTQKHDRRAFKVKLRAHIGYLVGYRASNIYRIWVPELQEVFTTRNVTFNEKLFYTDHNDTQMIPQAIARQVVDMIGIPDIRDPGELFEAIDALDIEEQPAEEPTVTSTTEIDLGGAQPQDSELPASQPESQESGVNNALERAASLAGKPLENHTSGSAQSGLLSPEETPELNTLGTGDGELDDISPDDRIEDTIVVNTDALLTLPTEMEEQGVRGDSEPLREVHSTEQQETEKRSREDHQAEARGPGETSPNALGESPSVTQRAPKRKYIKRSYVRTRASERIRARRDAHIATSIIMSTPLYTNDRIYEPQDPTWEPFLRTYLNKLPETVEYGDREHKTLHAVFSAAVFSGKGTHGRGCPQR